jgi:hypothetical protein
LSSDVMSEPPEAQTPLPRLRTSSRYSNQTIQ